MKTLLNKGTKCLIIQPEFSKFSFWNYTEVCKIAGARYPASPLGLMTVAALMPQYWEFKLIDANVKPLLDQHFEWADIVCIGGMLPQQKNILAAINKAHSFGLPVVVGGPDPSTQPELYKSADYLVMGEGEVTIPLLIEDLAKGYKSGKYQSEMRADMSKSLIPRFDLINFKDYIQIGMQYSRGCPFNCEFCEIIELYGRKPRTKSPVQMINEIQTLYDLGYRGHIDLVDDNFIGNIKEVKNTLRALREWSQKRKYPFFFSTESSINLADDDELLQLMKDVDFRYVFLGIETPENEILKFTNKKININIPVTEAIKKIVSYGIIVNAGFILGFDNESSFTADNMIKCIQDSGICMAMLGKLYALPSTQLTKRLLKENRLIADSSTLSGQDEIDQTTNGLNFLTTRPKKEILQDYIRIMEYIYNPKNYYKRVTYTGINLRPSNKHKPNFIKILKSIRSFSILFYKIGLNRKTGWLYWKMFFTIFFKNLKALEASINLAAMFIHFHKQSKFIIDITKKEINNLMQTPASENPK